jgi:ribosomal protein L7/L12
MMAMVRFVSWNPGFKKVTMNAVLREEAGLGLAEAKHVVDAILANRAPSVRVDEANAQRLVSRAEACGANVVVEADPSAYPRPS